MNIKNIINQDNPEWDIGEQIIFPVIEDIREVQVDAMIVDTKSNAIVFLSFFAFEFLESSS
jgi:hypothetical protein